MKKILFKEIIAGLAVLVILGVVVLLVGYRYKPAYFSFIDRFYNKADLTDTQQSLQNARDHIANKEYDKAISEISYMTKLPVVEPEVYRLLYAANSLKGDNEQARKWVKKYTETEPAIAKYWLDYVDLEKLYGTDTQEVYNIYSAAIKDVSRNTNRLQLVDIYNSYASYLIATGLYDEAVRYFELSKEIDSSRPEFYTKEIEFAKQEKLKYSR